MSSAGRNRPVRASAPRGGARPPRRTATRSGATRPGRAAASVAPPPPPDRRAPLHVRRLLTLLALVVLMALVVAPALSGFLRQRAEISAARQQIQSEQQEIADLEEQLALWEDKTYVEQQARERLRFVKQGETAFTVIDDTGTDYTEALPGMAPVSEEVLAASPWYGQVWESILVANEGLPETVDP